MAEGADEKKLCRTPRPDSVPRNIHLWKYDMIRDAVIANCPDKEPGIATTKLLALVTRQLGEEAKAKIGSLGWYFTSVRLEMEVAGELQRVPGAKPQRLVRNV